MMRFFLLLAVLIAACGGRVDASAVDQLPETTPDEVARLLATSELPTVVNVWASWCIPCRSEAPLLDRAVAEFDDRIRFVGINVRDSQAGARAFIAEFLAKTPIDHFFDPGGAVPLSLGGTSGVPLTFFFDAAGSLSERHFGVIDERTLALQIDELLLRGG